MTDDYQVKGRSDSDVHVLASKTRQFFGVAGNRRVDVLTCLEHESIWTVSGIKRLKCLVRSDSEMGAADGLTSHEGDGVTITIKKTVRDAAYLGDGRARNTIAHELGHAVMHSGVEMPRLATGNVTPKWIKPFESAEHQAKIFAPAFLINDEIAETLSNAEEISVEFGISLESARIYFDKLTALRNRAQTAEKMQRLAEELRESSASQTAKIKYLNDPCPVCGNRMLFPVDAKFMCQHCDNVFDRFQDGDLGEI